MSAREGFRILCSGAFWCDFWSACSGPAPHWLNAQDMMAKLPTEAR